MSKHTPGPWMANKPTQSIGRAEVYAGTMLVAQAINWMLDAEGEEQCRADARLIAAAPDLLAHLSRCAQALAHCMGNEYAPVVEARAAIAKAEATE